MSSVAALLSEIVSGAVSKLTNSGNVDSELQLQFKPHVTPTAEPRFGDYQTNIAMVLAKERKQNPRMLASELVNLIQAQEGFAQIASTPEIAGAGFINFRLKPEFLATKLIELINDPERLGVPVISANSGAPRKALIEFSGVNIAKPMHVGHLRSTIIGECLARVATFLGYNVTTDNHIGDWGTQFGRVIFGWKNFLDRKGLESDPLRELVQVYQLANVPTNPAELQTSSAEWKRRAKLYESENKNGEEGKQPKISPILKALTEIGPSNTEDPRIAELREQITKESRTELVKLQSGDNENLEIWNRSVELSRVELDHIYDRLGIHFDTELGESFYHPKLQPLVNRLEQEGIAEISDGALMIFFKEDPHLADKPAMIRKSDGGFNYTTTDLATFEYRVHELKVDLIWVVVGSPQILHFQQLNAAAKRMQIPVVTTHINFGSILGEDRKIMRTRSGESVELKELLDEAETRALQIIETKNPNLTPEEKKEIARVIGIGAVKYSELSQHRLTDYIFSWDKMLSFHGNTAPYLQNAYVRIQSIFRRFASSADLKDLGDVESSSGRLTFFKKKLTQPNSKLNSNSALELKEPTELTLIKKLLQFAEVVPAILEDFRPNLLANYLYELAGNYHSFFESCPVIKAPTEQQQLTRMILSDLTGRVLEKGLALLGIEVPQRM